MPKSLKTLVDRAGRLPHLASAAILGCCVAICVPILAYLLGSVVNCLIFAEQPRQSILTVSPWLPSVEHLLPDDLAPLAKITWMLGIMIALFVVACVVLLMFYRQIQLAAVAFEVRLISELRNHARRLAITRTLSAQQTSLTDCLDYHLPRVRASLGRWWRNCPRHFVQLFACVIVALLIAPMLTCLTLLATGLLVLVYRYVDRSRRTTLPVVRERAAQERSTVVQLSIKGSLFESVHNQRDVETRFADQLAKYQADAVRSLTSSSWKMPTLVLIGGILGCLFMFVVAVKSLVGDGFSVVNAFPFVLCLAGAAVSIVRLERSLRELNMLQSATDELNRFLSLSAEEIDDTELKAITSIHERAVLEHVTVQDSNGRRLLHDVSVTFQPGKLIGIVASQRLEGHALVELLMGFGRPVSGRMLVDGELVSNLKPQSLIKCAHWVASDGAIVTGTVLENLVGNAQQPSQERLNETLERAKLTETIQQLPDETMTLITPGDDRLGVDDAFRMAIARAAFRHASVVVIEEPDLRADAQVEQGSLDAIRSLVSPERITVVLPQRLLTLRQCDEIVMVHEHGVSDIGSHAELLQRNELYRHLNYLRFNPFRTQSAG
ncbi:MAG: ABC transporter ATP-binding protein [Pirellulaceae bacterium]